MIRIARRLPTTPCRRRTSPRTGCTRRPDTGRSSRWSPGRPAPRRRRRSPRSRYARLRPWRCSLRRGSCRRGRPFAAAPPAANPGVAVHFAGGGNSDALMMALVAAALALGDRGSVRAAGGAWALAVLVKWVPVLLLPLRGLEARARGRRVDHLGFAVTALIALGVATAL